MRKTDAAKFMEINLKTLDKIIKKGIIDPSLPRGKVEILAQLFSKIYICPACQQQFKHKKLTPVTRCPKCGKPFSPPLA